MDTNDRNLAFSSHFIAQPPNGKTLKCSAVEAFIDVFGWLGQTNSSAPPIASIFAKYENILFQRLQLFERPIEISDTIEAFLGSGKRDINPIRYLKESDVVIQITSDEWHQNNVILLALKAVQHFNIDSFVKRITSEHSFDEKKLWRIECEYCYLCFLVILIN